MKIAAVQTFPRFNDLSFNISNVINLVQKIESDLIVFPELCLSGYQFSNREDLRKCSFNVQSDSFKQIQNAARENFKTVIFGFAEEEESRIYNSSALILPDSDDVKIYRKTHLFYKERFIFDEGNTGFFSVYDQKNDCNIGMMICYDWRFPEAARSLGLLGADLIVCPSNLVTDLWHRVMPARAIENKVYLLVANRIGIENFEEELLFKGESGIWDYSGNLLAKAVFDKEEVIYADIEPTKTRNKSFNHINNIVADRRPEWYFNDKTT